MRLVMHPGPMNRGVEIDTRVADDIARSAITEQVEMGVAVRMACLDVLTRKRARRGGLGMSGLAIVGARIVDPQRAAATRRATFSSPNERSRALETSKFRPMHGGSTARGWSPRLVLSTRACSRRSRRRSLRAV